VVANWTLDLDIIGALGAADGPPSSGPAVGVQLRLAWVRQFFGVLELSGLFAMSTQFLEHLDLFPQTRLFDFVSRA
jgi:hypothetical protein